jgi:glycerophosphoryl diester phosphodiesterase
MAAFEHAVRLGVDGLELDVRLSRDGEAVVIHDETLERTTDASGPVAALTVAELARVDAGFRFRADDGAPFRGRGIGISTLRDVLRRFPDMPVIIESKGTDPEVAAAAAAVVRDENAGPRVCLAGFDDQVVQAGRHAAPGVASSAATREIRNAMLRARLWLAPRSPHYSGFQVPEVYGTTRVVTRRFVRVMRRAGLPVQVWTVNREDDIVRLLDWGVHAVLTDFPDRAVRVVGTRRAAR